MSQFEKLMSELGQLGTEQAELAKALPADDGKDEEKIQAAAGEGGSDNDADDEKEGGDKGDKPMAKSFKVTMADGTEADAMDGTEMVKALTDRLTVVETGNGELSKALETAVGVIKGFTPLIKSLQDQVTKLSGEGRGRKTVVSVVEKPAPAATVLAKSQTDGMTTDQFFAKALTAQKEGRVNGTDIAMAEACLNRGEAIPQSIVARVVQ